MGNHQDENGYWARFVYSQLPIKKARFPDVGIRIDIEPMLLALYRNIEKLPAIEYSLDTKGRELYKEFFDEMEELKINEPNQALRAVYSKYKRVAGEIALLLKIIHLGFYGESVDRLDNSRQNVYQKIEPYFMEAGIKLAKRYIREIKAIYVKSDESNQINKYQSIISLSNRKGWLKAKDVRNCSRQFKQVPMTEIRTLFKELVELGFGETRGEGNRLEWRIIENGRRGRHPVDTLSTETSTAETINFNTNTATNNKTVDTVDTNFNFSQGDNNQVVDINKKRLLSTELNQSIETNSDTAVDTPVYRPSTKTAKKEVKKAETQSQSTVDTPSTARLPIVSPSSTDCLTIDKEIISLAEKLNYDNSVLNSLSHDYFSVDDWQLLKEPQKQELKTQLKFKVSINRR